MRWALPSAMVSRWRWQSAMELLSPWALRPSRCEWPLVQSELQMAPLALVDAQLLWEKA